MGGGRDKRKKAKAKAGEISVSGAAKTERKTERNEAKKERREAAIEDSVLGGCRVSLNWPRRSDTRESHGRRRT